MKAFMATKSMSIDLLSATHHCIFHHCIIEQYLTSLKESNVHTYVPHDPLMRSNSSPRQ